jgi:hypothetical protein
MSGSWGAATSFEQVKRRAGGRRRYNAMRQRAAALRRRQVAWYLFGKKGWFGMKGVRLILAKKLRVSITTINRDIADILAEGFECRLCGTRLFGQEGYHQGGNHHGRARSRA